MEGDIDISYMGATQIEINATNGATVNITVVSGRGREEDTLRDWADNIERETCMKFVL